MRITIFGAGKTGQYLTRVLAIEGHEVTVIEQDIGLCNKLSSSYDISTIRSEGIRRDVFNEETFASCELFIAVGPVDETNIIACSVAKKMGAEKTIARVRNEDYGMMEDVVDLRAMGIDEVVHPEKELSRELVNLVTHPNAIDVNELYNGRIMIVSTIVKENSNIVNKSLAEISNIHDLSELRIVVVEEGQDASIPGGGYVIKAGDKIFAVSDRANVETAFEIAGYTEGTSKDIMINGSGKVARSVAMELEKRGSFNIKLIVDEEEKAALLSELLTRSLVVHGEATDLDILAAEGIIDMDFFLALTGNDETNVVSSLLANHLKVNKTITLIEKTDYLPITKTIGLQRCVNSSLSTTNGIMRFARHSNVKATSSLKGIDIDAISYRVSAANKYIGKPLRDIRFPRGSIVGVIVRNGQIFVPTGEHHLDPGDEIVVFHKKSAFGEVEKMFAD
jgi:trk system potassium uptake protein TrkA